MGPHQSNCCLSSPQSVLCERTNFPPQFIGTRYFTTGQHYLREKDIGVAKASQYTKSAIDETNSHQENVLRSRLNSRDLKDDREQGYQEELLKSKSKKLTLDDFVILKCIGSGSFANVYKGYLKADQAQKDKKMYAIKQMKKSEIHEIKLFSNIKLEKIILKQSSSNFIPSFGCAFSDDHFYYIVMEYAAAGDVCSLISQDCKNRRKMKIAGEKVIRFILGCVVLALEYLHSKGIVHQDVKPDNMLIFSDGYIKMTDFGFARNLYSLQKQKAKAGTPEYFAPEIIMKEDFGKPVDLWTLGVVAYILLTFQFPFDAQIIEDRKKYQEAVLKEEKERQWRGRTVSKELKDLINGLLKRNPFERIGANGWYEIKEHSFFKGFDWEALASKKMESPLLPMINIDLLEETPDPLDLNMLTRLTPQDMEKGHYSRWEWSSQDDIPIQ